MNVVDGFGFEGDAEIAWDLLRRSENLRSSTKRKLRQR